MFGRKSEPEAPVNHAEPVKAGPGTVIGSGITMVGDFKTSEVIKISGGLRGNIESTSEVIIAKDGFLAGDAKAEFFNVDGSIDGNIECANTASFSSSARLTGSLVTNELRTESGAFIDGQIRLLFGRSKKEEQDAQEPREI